MSFPLLFGSFFIYFINLLTTVPCSHYGVSALHGLYVLNLLLLALVTFVCERVRLAKVCMRFCRIALVTFVSERVRFIWHSFSQCSLDRLVPLLSCQLAVGLACDV